MRGDYICHDLVGKILRQERGQKCRILDFDMETKEPLAIYFRHRNADSYSRHNYNRTFRQDTQDLRSTFIDEGRMIQFKEMFNFLPDDTSPTYSVAMVAMARKENQYINNWIEYHRNLGVNHFYIYDNSFDDEESLDGAITRSNMEVTTIIPAQNIQRYMLKAYEQAYSIYGSQHDYMMFIDIDEFFTLQKHRTIQEYIQYLKWQCPHFHTAKINWEIYDDNNALERDMSIPP